MEIIEGLIALATLILFFGLVLGILNPKWVRQKTRGGVLKTYGLGSLVFVTIGGFMMPVPEPGEAAEPAAVRREVTPVVQRPEPVLSPENQLRALLTDALSQSNRDVPRVRDVTVAPFLEADRPPMLTIQWSINDNLTRARIASSARFDAIEILETLMGSGIPFEGVLLQGTASMCDTMGRCQETIVIAARYSRETLQQVNWSNFLSENIWVIAENGVTLHPEFR